VPTSRLPARSSLESLRKQAKKLARAVVAGDRDAIARVHAQLPTAKLPLSQREAQLVLAREYGSSGWKDLIKEVKQRLGGGPEWAASEARRIIHDNDIEGLRQLLAKYPPLLSCTLLCSRHLRAALTTETTEPLSTRSHTRRPTCFQC
jgi:hypothetical protein